MRFVIFLMLGVVLLASLSLAAGFECDRATSVQEQLICGDPTLSALDDKLSGLYALALDVIKAQQALRDKQIAWLAHERSRCADVPCLSAAYEKRLTQLFTLLKPHTHPIGPHVEGRIDDPPSKSWYCQQWGGSGYFSVAVRAQDHLVTGRVDGVHDCGRKVWGEVEFTGHLVGHIALVEFDGGFAHEARGKAFIAVTADRIYWQIFEKVQGESYVPTTGMVRRAKPTPSRARQPG
jgi:uncharacterized protein